MNCWHCQENLTWGGDHDCEDDDEYLIVTNLSCPTCKSVVYVYLPKPEESKTNEMDIQKGE